MIARFASIALVVLLAAAAPGRGQSALGDARDLYASAAFEEALALLDRLKGESPPPASLREIEQYRALCLLALKRQPEAEQAIEALVAIDPFYRPGEADAAPWVRASFAEVRRRLLPAAAQRQYVEAKALFGRQEYGKAAALLIRILAITEDPDLGSLDDHPMLADLRTLAEGFLELSQTALAKATTDALPDPPPRAPGGTPPAGQAVSEDPAAPREAIAAPAPLRIYSLADRDVTAPTVVFQQLPNWPAELNRFITRERGLLEIVIDESGLVSSAIMREPLNRAYDAVLIEAARTWRYTAATRDGKPVKYRRLIEVRGPSRIP